MVVYGTINSFTNFTLVRALISRPISLSIFVSLPITAPAPASTATAVAAAETGRLLFR